MVELVDTHDLGSCAERRESSSLSEGTYFLAHVAQLVERPSYDRLSA